MEVTDLLLIAFVALTPAILVYLSVQSLIKRFFEREYAEKVKEVKDLSREKIQPLRLQAYERFLLYLERINPNNSILNLYKVGMSAKMLQVSLVEKIRNEFDHNMAQQLYISDSGWEAVRNAKEETLKIINMAAKNCGPDATGIDLSNKIYEIISQLKELPTDTAAVKLKIEARRLF